LPNAAASNGKTDASRPRHEGWSYFGGADQSFLRWWGWVSLIFSLVFGVLRPVVVE
jgi:hypothetical protein